MRTALFANGDLGEAIARHLDERGDLAVLVLHPAERRRWRSDPATLSCPTMTWPAGPGDFEDGPMDCVLSVLFGYLLPPDLLDLARWRAVNLHPALLPWNRGADPNVWPLVDGSPAGTTLHVMAPELDAGPVLAQREVAYGPADTARTLYRRLTDESYDLFVETWPTIGAVVPTDQEAGGSYHRRADLEDLDLTRGDLPTVDKLRARTFDDYGAVFERGGRRYRATISIDPIDQD